MKDFEPQIQRIKEKLAVAKIADKNFKVFGSSSHKYHLDPPVDMKTVEDFEKEHNITLPIEYKLFMTEIGNGGISHDNSGAGPHYGIYPFGEEFQILFNDWDAHQLASPHLLYPKMSDEFWSKKVENLDGEDVTEAEYEKREAELLGGIFVIGTQGCTYFHGLVVNGEFAGRVINIDLDHQKPKFSYEANFLDWYEHWLDDVIEGNLSDKDSGSFGYNLGGSEEELLSLYENSNDNETKLDALNGLLFKKHLTQHTTHEIQNYLYDQTPEVQLVVYQLLMKHDYETAKMYLNSLFIHNLNEAVKLLHWYGKEHKKEWIDTVQIYLREVKDEETFRFATYILQEDPDLNFEVLKDFATHENADIRKQTFYTFSFLKDKSAYEKEFLIGLDAENPNELIEVLQAMKGLKTKAILKKLQELVHKYPYKEIKPKFGMQHYTDSTDDLVYITSNLESVLKEYGLDCQSIANLEIENFDLNGK